MMSVRETMACAKTFANKVINQENGESEWLGGVNTQRR